MEYIWYGILFNGSYEAHLSSVTVTVRKRMSMILYDGQMMFVGKFGLNFLKPTNVDPW